MRRGMWERIIGVNIRLVKPSFHFLPITPFIEGISFGILREGNGMGIPSGL